MAGVLLGLGLLAALKVTAEGACPSAAAVQARLVPLLPAQVQEDLPAIHAHIEPIDELLRVEVRSEDGALLSVRDLQRAAPCADLAAAAAVVIASALLSAPRVAAAPQVTLPPPPPMLPPPRPAPRPRPDFDVGVAIGLAATASGATVGGSVLAHVRAPGQRLGVRVAAAATALRREAIGDAGAQWTRAQLELGPSLRVRPGRLLVDLHLHAAAALVAVAGEGFASNYQSLGWDAGLGAGLRLGLPLRWALPFVGVSATAYLRPQDLLVTGLPGSTTLPRFDAVISLGFGAGRWR